MKSIDKYRIRGLLGRGGMAKVLKVEVPVIHRILALKLLSPGELLVRLAGRAQLERLFTAEAVALAGIRHANIIDVFDYGTFRGCPYYIMDYYGNNLGAVIGETGVTEAPTRVLRLERAVHYTTQMLTGLHRLHAVGIIHRDMKPFNILLTDDDTVKICDFGLSKLRGEKIRVPSGLKVGSPYYAAPEQEIDPHGVDRTADLYSVGVMLYRMLTGTLPRDPPQPASRFNPDLDAAWDDFLSRALASRPSMRHPDAPAMADELAALYQRWQNRREAACRWVRADREDAPAAERFPRPRSKPIRTGTRDARGIFGLTRLWQPRIYRGQAFQRELGGRTVRDESTGLQWQYGGSEFPMTWSAALDAVRQLNARGWAGYGDWRLPTVDELLTLLRPPPPDSDDCLAPVFATLHKRLWSSDRRTYTSAWYVSLELGFVGWQDRTFACHVKGVRSVS